MKKNKEKEAVKAKERQEKAQLKNVNMAVPCVETEIRKEQFSRDQHWKATTRETKSELKDVNMAVPCVETEIRKGE